MLLRGRAVVGHRPSMGDELPTRDPNLEPPGYKPPTSAEEAPERYACTVPSQPGIES